MNTEPRHTGGTDRPPSHLSQACVGHLKEIDIAAWRSFAEASESRTIFHSPDWISFLSDHYRLPLRIHALVDGHAVLAAIPFLETRSLRQRRKLISLPFSDVVPVISRDQASLERLLESLRSSALPEYDSVEIRSPAALPGLPLCEDWACHILAIPQSYSELATGFSSSIRRNLKKAQASDLRFSVSTELAAMDAFYRLHVLTRRKLGVPVQTLRFFQDMHARVIGKGFGFLGLVYSQDAVAAAGVFLHWGGVLTYKFGASDPARLALRPNDFLFANVLRVAVERSFREFDFGVSRHSDLGLRRFKTQWGSQETPVAHCYLKGLPESGAGPQMPRLASALIRSSPAFVCRALGAVFYRSSQ
jgi:CelD/BcsL family acetyltransferase involved in cellulose biosynthesis